VLNAFVSRYGITVADLKNRVRDDLLRQAVAARVTASSPDRTPAIRLGRLESVTQAENLQIKAKLSNGETFAQIAAELKKNSIGPCKQGCGDLGWIPTAFLPPYQKNLATAPVGKLVGPLRLQKGGFELYEVLARDNQYPMTPAQQITMRNQILFPHWLSAQLKRASVKRYVAV
jgi:hypothetical protein